MQDLLTVLIQTVAIASIAIFALDLYACLFDCWEHAALTPQLMPMSEPELTAPKGAVPAPIATTPVATLQPVMDTKSSKAKSKKEWARSQVEAAPAVLAEMTAMRLRKLCTERNIKWRNAHGKGLHLTKNEMLARLTA
ncbi:hypothetical protein C7Y66_14545 [Chroococcidiopsis sp. CCALA 051]|uniref:hypothetical protein n=1 Tax=Chroococcidiopsis sp. CCALA 051 TaxID=869949 RepID=UPI000D2692D8|nr:hypothetical protein [Chroococcidiopsis sp. CCALA 051]MBE9018606.1 hypothetical protein [Chroococcidiopsidales cyanobacterium LEGE 13417]PSM48437.1 hypothetical protein C7Y66_14545 [Chroococcidiopsis sp. CCALA 051]